MTAPTPSTDAARTAYVELVASLRTQRWYLVADDEVGGYALANRDAPTSQLDLDRGDRLVADVVHADLGRYLVALHDAYLEERSVVDALLAGADPGGPPSALVDVVRRTVLAELRALVDAAFPDDDCDWHYALERLLELTQDRRSALAAGAVPLPPHRPGDTTEEEDVP